MVIRPYTRKDLEEAFKAMGKWADHKWIIKQEAEGRLRCPREPHNNWRVFTEEEINEIVEAFSAGGKGYWYYDEQGRK
jgi:hypothetical protein